MRVGDWIRVGERISLLLQSCKLGLQVRSRLCASSHVLQKLRLQVWKRVNRRGGHSLSAAPFPPTSQSIYFREQLILAGKFFDERLNLLYFFHFMKFVALWCYLHGGAICTATRLGNGIILSSQL